MTISTTQLYGVHVRTSGRTFGLYYVYRAETALEAAKLALIGGGGPYYRTDSVDPSSCHVTVEPLDGGPVERWVSTSVEELWGEEEWRLIAAGEHRRAWAQLIEPAPYPTSAHRAHEVRKS